MEYRFNKEKQSELTFDDLNFGELFVWENGNKDSVAMKVKLRERISPSDEKQSGYAYLDGGSVWVIGGKYSKLASDSVIRVSSNEVIFNTVSS